MTDSLVKLALAGTTQGTGHRREPTTGTPLDPIVAQVGADAERRLLLAAGAAAVYRQAGRALLPGPEPSDPAPPDMLPTCSPGAARIIGELLARSRDERLIEAVHLMRDAGRRLPHDLLPAALGTEWPLLRRCLSPVLGERGRWLARLNPDWAWALDRLPDSPELPPHAERTWQEGSHEQRLDVLRHTRSQDPELARKWLEAGWKGENAERRAELLAALTQGLSLADEPFLEVARKDRSTSVRACAAELLARIPGSAFAARSQSRADKVLAYTAPATGGGLLHKARSLATGSGRFGKLTIHLPEIYEEEWRADGIERKPPRGQGERSWWLAQILALVPPSHWQERFGATPQHLVAAASAQTPWGPTVIEGWSDAAVLHRDAAWLTALWAWWYRNDAKNADPGRLVGLLRALATVAPEDSERLVMDALRERRGEDGKPWHELLKALRSPWSTEMGEVYLEISGWRASNTVKGRPYEYDLWLQTLPHAAHALPPDTFIAALRSWDLPDADTWQVRQWRTQVRDFTEVVQTRQRLREEIRL